ncbi:hypothetical protein CPB84DRAFT_1789744 [Gymnopilus junonius]|uniref:F-box domain-containing protein n=1 Tax=Gymnopilus junonius TaxID=109634 RepID=A0A9P5NFL7_GYMJU|nr:hypothetical protein CPB84DRAFT_1789744 [Gymnopilus junonius]
MIDQNLDPITTHPPPLSSIIQQVPDDVLAEIFLSSLSDDIRDSSNPNKSPLLVTHICSQWRRVAHLTPRLWRRIDIPVNRGTQTTVQGRFQRIYDVGKEQAIKELVEQWLFRSGTGLSLDIIIRGRRTRLVLEVILPFASRWRQISFISPDRAGLDHLKTISSSDVPLLEEFSLGIGEEEADFQNREDYIPFGCLQAPMLRKLAVKRLLIDSLINIGGWERLTHFSLNAETEDTTTFSYESSKVARLLTLCTNLTSFTGILRNMDPNAFIDQTSISLPFLSSLSIHQDISSVYITQNLSLQNLTNLRLHQSLFILGRSMLREVVMQCGSVLQSLTTDKTMYGAGELLDCLRNCPNLKSLTTQATFGLPLEERTYWNSDPHSHIWDDKFLRGLIPSVDSQIICPKLEIFKCVQQVMFSDTILFDFVKGRRGSTALKYVGVKMKDAPENEFIISFLQPFIHEGLVFEFL